MKLTDLRSRLSEVIKELTIVAKDLEIVKHRIGHVNVSILVHGKARTLADICKPDLFSKMSPVIQHLQTRVP